MYYEIRLRVTAIKGLVAKEETKANHKDYSYLRVISTLTSRKPLKVPN
jgi:hypothetical protein